MSSMKRSLYCVVGACFLAFTSAHAYDGEVVGKVDILVLKSNVSSQALIVYLEGRPSLCGHGSPDLTLMNRSDALLPEIHSLLLGARFANEQVKLVSDFDGSHCRLKQVVLY
ncbi:MAG: hypothetical protein AAGA68_02365 [Pseudomonadota bacterium]